MTGLLAVGCAAGSSAPDPRSAPSDRHFAAEVPSTPPSSSRQFAAEVPQAPQAPQAESTVVVLDPGHNGGNAAAQAEISRHVPAGRGRTKPCNTTGTASDDGYPEHQFTFDVARRVRALLAGRGITVVLTRDDDSSVGPCVDRRAAVGNAHRADAVVSIHADGHTDPSARGFHIAYSAPPLNDAQGEPALGLARAMRTAMQGAGFPLSTYAGTDGFTPRDDLAGLNLSERPAVLVECGNMRNAGEAAAMTSAAGRQRYADAIAGGILAYLGL